LRRRQKLVRLEEENQLNKRASCDDLNTTKSEPGIKADLSDASNYTQEQVSGNKQLSAHSADQSKSKRHS
jgi:hypothetical protein